MESFPVDGANPHEKCREDPIAHRWAAINQAVNALTILVGGPAAGAGRKTELYPVDAGNDADAMAHGLDDLVAVLEKGLFAVLQARENGADASIAARTLLANFERRKRDLLTPIEEAA